MKRSSSLIHDVYEKLVAQARCPLFYEKWEVPDTLDGRFEMVCLHVMLVLHRLKDVGPQDGLIRPTRDFGQALYDRMFADFDVCLREMGVGDLRVGTRIKDMVKAFHGRLESYTQALSAKNKGDKANLAEALRRNLYGTKARVSDHVLEDVCEYVSRLHEALKAFDVEDILEGDLPLSPPVVS